MYFKLCEFQFVSFCTVYGSSLFGIDYVENEADSLGFFFVLFFFGFT